MFCKFYFTAETTSFPAAIVCDANLQKLKQHEIKKIFHRPNKKVTKKVFITKQTEAVASHLTCN